MNINPTAFSVFGYEIKWYGILIAIGAFLAIQIAKNLAKRENIKEDYIYDFALYGLLFGIIGARAYYVIFEWDYYSVNKSEILAFRNGGLAIYGGIIAGIIVGLVYCNVKKIKFFKLADIIAPGLVLAQSIGRWGNFINKEAHGEVTNVPWAINVNGQMVHPTFFYESFMDFLIFLFLYFYLYKRKKYDGEIFSFYMILYGIVRFFVEGLRTDSLYLGSFRVSQLVSICIVILGVVILHIQKRKVKN